MASPVGDFLATLRAGAILAMTPTALGLFELERSRARDDVPVLRKWTRRYGKLALAIYGAHAVSELAHVGPNATYPGRDARGMGHIFVSNHRSMLDVFAAVRFLEGDFVARADMRHWPVIGFVAGRIGTIWVDRDSRSSGAADARRRLAPPPRHPARQGPRRGGDAGARDVRGEGGGIQASLGEGRAARGRWHPPQVISSRRCARGPSSR